MSQVAGSSRQSGGEVVKQLCIGGTVPVLLSTRMLFIHSCPIQITAFLFQLAAPIFHGLCEIFYRIYNKRLGI